jgi:hypothetical protein
MKIFFIPIPLNPEFNQENKQRYQAYKCPIPPFLNWEKIQQIKKYQKNIKVKLARLKLQFHLTPKLGMDIFRKFNYGQSPSVPGPITQQSKLFPLSTSPLKIKTGEVIYFPQVF